MARETKIEKTAPYCPPGTLLLVTRYYRKQDVPPTLTKERLTQLGVPDTLLNRTWGALVFLGLIDEGGKTTEDLKAIRFANEEQYPKVFGGILRKAYADIFSVIGETAAANDVKLDNAFTPYTPGGQRDRMKILFIGLCAEAGVPLGVTRTERKTRVEASAARPARAQRTGKPAVRGGGGPVQKRGQITPEGPDAALVAWFNSRPDPSKAWPHEAREKWEAPKGASPSRGRPPPNRSMLVNHKSEALGHGGHRARSITSRGSGET